MARLETAADGRTAGKFRFAAASATLAATLLLLACDEAGKDKKPETQVAARVNASEISIHQVNFALRNLPGLLSEQGQDAKRQVLDALVDQELAIQAALAAKLDRSPNIMQSIEAARREILANAYMEQVAAKAAPPSADDIAAYFRQHPELFSKRKLYHLQEAVLPRTPEVTGVIREQLLHGRNAAELETWFKDRRQQVSGKTVIKPAEKLDLDILPKLAAMKEGQTAMFENGAEISVITVLTAIAEPMSETEARPLIEQYLKRQRGDVLEKEATRQLRSKARIEYLGEFSADAETARKRQAADAARQIEDAEAARVAARAERAAEVARGK